MQLEAHWPDEVLMPPFLNPAERVHRQHAVVCPVCHGQLLDKESDLSCSACGEIYPVVSGVPILINDRNSVFRKADYLPRSAGVAARRPLWHRVASRLLAWVPGRTLSSSELGLQYFIQQILAAKPNANILVIGCGTDRSPSDAGAPLVTYTDVALSPLTQVVCDAHDLPFEDGSFDAVLAVAVMEHVIHPTEVVGEIERVLKSDGFVFAAVPFLQAVHMGAYDFTRWTYTGLRALFAGFSEIHSGISNGPATTLRWSVEYFLTSFFNGNVGRSAASSVARLLTVWLVFFDRMLIRKAGSYDGASSFHFFGRKSATRLSPREIVGLNRGLNPR